MKMIIEQRQRNGFFVQLGDRFADQLCADEALGVVAAWIFGPHPIYLRSYTEWSLLPYNRSEIAGLLPAPQKENT